MSLSFHPADRAFSAAVEANRAQDVQEALGRLIEETPNLPVSASNPYARLSADVAASIAPLDWPAAHPWAETFPGLAADGSAIESETVNVELSYSKAQPFGVLRQRRASGPRDGPRGAPECGVLDSGG